MILALRILKCGKEQRHIGRSLLMFPLFPPWRFLKTKSCEAFVLLVVIIPLLEDPQNCVMLQRPAVAAGR